MSRVRFNIAANLAGQVWFVLLTVVCTPFYIKLLGIEAYGLIAFYLVYQGILQLLDFGLGTTVNRQVAKLTGEPTIANQSAMARFVVSIERWYWMLGCGVGVILLLTTPLLAGWWLRPEQLSQQDLTTSARFFGIIVLLQWPTMFYVNGLLGLQRQVVLNAIQIPFAGLTSIGGLVFIWLGPRSVSGLLAWQAFVLMIQLGVLYSRFWKLSGVLRNDGRVDMSVLRDNWRFSLGISGISIAGLVLGNLDKVILSRLLSLESFGLYSLAGTLAKGLYVLMTPVFNAYFPRFSAVVSAGDAGVIRMTYHSATQVMAVLSLPLAAVIVLFASEIAYLWLHDMKVAADIAPIAGLLTIGNCLNGLMSIPLALQLAHGNTRIGFYICVFLILVLGPAVVLVTTHYGAVGGAAMWAVVNVLYIVVGVAVTHRYLLIGEAQRWVIRDVLPPMTVTILVTGAGRLLIPHELPAALSLFAVVLLWMVATLCAAASAGQVRQWGLQFVASLRRA